MLHMFVICNSLLAFWLSIVFFWWQPMAASWAKGEGMGWTESLMTFTLLDEAQRHSSSRVLLPWSREFSWASLLRGPQGFTRPWMKSVPMVTVMMTMILWMILRLINKQSTEFELPSGLHHHWCVSKTICSGTYFQRPTRLEHPSAIFFIFFRNILCRETLIMPKLHPFQSLNYQLLIWSQSDLIN